VNDTLQASPAPQPASDPFAHPFITAAWGALLVQRRRADGAIETLWRKPLSKGREGTTLTDGKVQPGRDRIAALVGGFAGLVSHPSGEILHKVDANERDHSIEVIPDGPYLILACSDKRIGLRVFDMLEKSTTKPVHVYHLPSAHAVHWDAPTKSLWALGANRYPEVDGAVHGELRRYRLTGDRSKPLGEPVVYRMRDSPKLAAFPGWRDGPHDLLLLPHSRTFLISTDLDVYQFDISAADPRNKPEENFTPARNGILKDFEPRRPQDGFANIKAMSLSKENDLLITQADQDYYSTYLSSYNMDTHVRTDLQLPFKTYKARWFTDPRAERHTSHPSAPGL
jgi:hypothetical protein